MLRAGKKPQQVDVDQHLKDWRCHIDVKRSCVLSSQHPFPQGLDLCKRNANKLLAALSHEGEFPELRISVLWHVSGRCAAYSSNASQKPTDRLDHSSLEPRALAFNEREVQS